MELIKNLELPTRNQAAKKVRAPMSQEQLDHEKERRNDAAKKARAAMPKELRDHEKKMRNEAARKARAAMPQELRDRQKQKRNEADRKARAAMPQELRDRQKLKRNEAAKKARAAMSQELRDCCKKEKSNEAAKRARSLISPEDKSKQNSKWNEADNASKEKAETLENKKQAVALIPQKNSGNMSQKRKKQNQERDEKPKKPKLPLTPDEQEEQRQNRNAKYREKRALLTTFKGKIQRRKHNATIAAQRALLTSEEQEKQNNEQNTKRLLDITEHKKRVEREGRIATVATQRALCTKLKQHRLNITEPEKLVKREDKLESMDPKEREDMQRFKNDNLTKAREEVADDVQVGLDTLALTILGRHEIKEDVIEFLAENQRYTSHPDLALAYYHLCSSHPDAFVFNDEKLNGEEGKAVCERLKKAIGDPIGQEEASRCQRHTRYYDPSAGRIAACASCNEILFECDNVITETTFNELHQSFELSEEQMIELHKMDQNMVKDFVSVVSHNNKLYHLNPDLIPNLSEIVLCKTCEANPLNHPYSIASGHDYGRLKKFPKINGVTLGAVVTVRNYNISLSIKSNHSTGNSICFPSNGAVQTAKHLPVVDVDRIPHVTFLGPKDRWRKEKKRWRHLYRLDSEMAYEALRIWRGLNNTTFDGVEVNDTPGNRAALERKALELIEQSLIISENPTVQGVSDAAEADYNENENAPNADLQGNHNNQDDENNDDGDDITDETDCDAVVFAHQPLPAHQRTNPEEITTIEPHFRHFAVMPQQSLATTGLNAGINAFCELVKVSNRKKGKKSRKATKDQARLQEETMSPEALAMIAEQDKNRTARTSLIGIVETVLDDDDALEEEIDSTTHVGIRNLKHSRCESRNVQRRRTNESRDSFSESRIGNPECLSCDRNTPLQHGPESHENHEIDQTENDDVSSIQSSDNDEHEEEAQSESESELANKHQQKQNSTLAGDELTEQDTPSNENTQKDTENPFALLQDVIVVERGSQPISEFDENDKMLAGAFPHLFLLGKGLPQREMNQTFLKHCFKYYDGRFDDPMWIATAFNQKQRHACIRNTARIAAGNPALFEMLGTLANSAHFKQKLIQAIDHPESQEAKRLNAKICRIFALVGKTIPFSPFERACTRPMLAAMRLRYSTSFLFHTGSPPEFEDLMILRISQIEQFNDKSCEISRAGFTRDKLPSLIRNETGVRMKLTQARPSLCAEGFIRKQKILNNAILGCPTTTETRFSRPYLHRKQGAFGKVAAHNTVIEPQLGGRLHWHKSLYASALTPSLLNRLAGGPDHLISHVAKVMESLSCTNVNDECHAWYDEILQNETIADAAGLPRKRPRAAELPVPDANKDYAGFQQVAMQKAMLTNMHVHGFSCEKTKTGRYMCRLALPRGDNEGHTEPFLITGSSHNVNLSKGQRPDLHQQSVLGDEQLQLELDSPYSPLEGELTRPPLRGPIVWEMHRPKKDALFVEPNLVVTNLLECHNNASLITGKDSGEAVEEYTCAYMVKEGAPLRQATAVLLAAVGHVSKYESRAKDSGTDERTGKYLAQRTLNAFIGSHQWSMPLMAYALCGFRSYTTTESFIYIFPHDNVSYINKHKPFAIQTKEDHCLHEDSENAEEEKETALHEQVSMEDFLAQIEDSAENTKEEKSGATLYKVEDKCIFLTQAESYINRGEHFKNYSQLEFECIVELERKRKPKPDPRTLSPRQRAGRKARKGFDLGPDHPLYTSHQGFIRAKMRTAMLGGSPPPSFPGNLPPDPNDFATWKTKMDHFAKYLMGFIVPWQHGQEPMFSFDTDGLAKLIDAWDRRSASLVNRQRFRMIDNFIGKGNRNNHNEKIATFWRGRCAQFWSALLDDDGRPVKRRRPAPVDNNGTQMEFPKDREASLQLECTELLELTSSIATGINEQRLQAIQKLRESCIELHSTPPTAVLSNPMEPPNNTTGPSPDTEEHAVVYRHHYQTAEDDAREGFEGTDGFNVLRQNNMTLSQIRDEIRDMLPIEGLQASSDHLHNEQESNSASHDVGPPEVDDPSDISTILDDLKNYVAPDGFPLTEEQEKVVAIMLSGARDNQQQLLFLHSGGGTGKSTVVRALFKILRNHGFTQANTCPTGVGATLLDQGKTFHSVFRVATTDLNASTIIDDIRRELGGDRLKVVVIDEVSMLDSKYLVLLHNRLASMYDPTKIFGGISILILGDFIQLPPVHGTSLYRTLYSNVNPENAQVRALFQKFRVIELEQQLRAGTCQIQQRRLKAFRRLPQEYPSFGDRWTKKDKDKYQPMTDDVIDGLTTQLTRGEIAANEKWTTDATCLTTTNIDRSVINNTVAQIFGSKKKRRVIRWKRELVKAFEETIRVFMHELLYSEDTYPELFGYFVHGARGQILDNGNGNVVFGVANGTACTFIGLGWDDPGKEEAMHQLTSAPLETDTSLPTHCHLIDLPYPPDCIIVEVHLPDPTKWPRHLNLSKDANRVFIPIGLKSCRRASEKDSVKLPNNRPIEYKAHAVDLSFAITTWKSQGGTFEYIIALLESFTGAFRQRLTYELLYVMFSRVKEAVHFRCMPLSAENDLRARLRRYYPNIYATKYRMDINEDGYWDSTRSEIQEQEQPRGIAHRNRPLAAIARTVSQQTHAIHAHEASASIQQSPSLVSQQIDLPPQPTHDFAILDAAPFCHPLPSAVVKPNTTQLSLSMESGLPLRDNRFSGIAFTFHGRQSLEDGQWLNDEAVDLFSILTTQEHEEEAFYLPSNQFTFFYTQNEAGVKEALVFDPAVLSERQAQMTNKRIWITTVSMNNHWQVLCIFNPGTANCFAIIFDSLLQEPTQLPSNYDSCKTFVISLHQEIFGRSLFQDIRLHVARVVQQPNGTDCGVYAILNLHQVLSRLQSLTDMAQWLKTVKSVIGSIDCGDWYTTSFATEFRHVLQFSYDELLARYGV